MVFSGAHLPDLVHHRLGDDQAERSRHEHFILTRLVIGVCGLAFLPLFLAMRGAPSLLDAVLALALAGPVFAAAILSLTGRLVPASSASAASSAGLVVCIAASSQNVFWPVLLWLAVEPLDALLAGSKRAALASATTSFLTLAALTLALVGGTAIPGAELVVSPWPGHIAVAFLAATALIQAFGRSSARMAGAAGSREDVSAGVVEDSSLLAIVGDVVTWHDRAGEVLKASPSAARFVGAPAAALLGQGLVRHVHVSDRPAYLRALSSAANGAAPATAEFRLHVSAEPAGEDEAARSQVVWVEMRAQRIETAGGEAVVLSIIRDMSARRRHAEELDKARCEAERADELKSRFLANVSHELRTPLNAIIGFSELLAVDHPIPMNDDRRKEYADIIRTSGHHLLEVVNTLLDMSKIETGNFTFEPEAFCLGELAEGCCDLMQVRADQAGIALKLQVARELPEIMADRRACRQILINLLSNAVKFTPAEGRVTVSVLRDRDRVVLAVSDTGIGVGEGDLPRLGDPFFQAGDAYRRPHEGTGLGLSVVRGLVGLHQGALSIESGAGAGTTVTVSLPVQCSQDRPETKPVSVHTLVRHRPPQVTLGPPLERLSA
jgi:cell cycle sensor histidine kinase DivJ